MQEHTNPNRWYTDEEIRKLHDAFSTLYYLFRPNGTHEGFHQALLCADAYAEQKNEAAQAAAVDEKTAERETIREQIMAIRDEGRANMLDTNAVQRLAYEHDFYELVNFIEDDRKAYSNFIFTGRWEG
jgi:hypothetical protein